jgi:hypothetical protein
MSASDANPAFSREKNERRSDGKESCPTFTSQGNKRIKDPYSISSDFRTALTEERRDVEPEEDIPF